MFTVGRRVELSPALDSWMMGDRYGAIVKVTRTHVHVLMDRSQKTRKYPLADIDTWLSLV